MLGQVIIVFREALEAVLVITLLTTLSPRDGRKVLIGGATAVLTALFLGLAAYRALNTVPQDSKLLLEAGLSLAAALAITYTIFLGNLPRKDVPIGFFTAGFMSVLREALETVLFLLPFVSKDAFGTLTAVALGSTAAGLLAVVFRSLERGYGPVFSASTVLLSLVSGGLVGSGAEGLLAYAQGNGVNTGFLGSTAYSLPVGRDNLLHHENIIGSILSTFGYSAEATWGRVIAQASYLVAVFTLAYWRSSAEAIVKPRPFPPPS